jgi:hypothetical protein
LNVRALIPRTWSERLTYRDRDRVVLVDDRHDAHAQQLGQRVDGVEVARSIRNVAPGEQDLGDRLRQLRKEVVPEGDEPALADGSERLQ